MQKSLSFLQRTRRGAVARLIGMCALTVSALSAPVAHAADEAPQAFIERISTAVLNDIKKDASLRGGDNRKIMALVDSEIMPNVNFRRMTSLAVGPAWRQATEPQRAALQEEFKKLLVRTYSGALAEVSDQQIRMQPFRGDANASDVLVRTQIVGRGEPIQMDYRLEKTPGDAAGWKIYNMNVLGVWLVENYRNQFAQEINKGGIDGLIQSIRTLNSRSAAPSP